eukprot:gene23221-26289_t
MALLEYGNAIKELVAANIFPGDMLYKNFGVTRHKRVVFYDYDEIEYITDCVFRDIPEARTEEEEMSAEPWYHVGKHDVFPEQFGRFLLGNAKIRKYFMQHHADLLTREFWQRRKERIEAGIVEDVFPYPQHIRFSYQGTPAITPAAHVAPTLLETRRLLGQGRARSGRMTAYGYMFSIVSAFGVGWLADRYGAVRVSATVTLAAPTRGAQAQDEDVLAGQWQEGGGCLERRFLFHVPMQGSLVVLVLASMLYLFVAVGMGLVISSVTRNQFLASQVALLSSFMPSLMLSGFLFDLRNVPRAVQYVGNLLPATYFMELIKTLFLAGNVWPLIFKNCAILAAYAVLLLAVARAVTRKRLD